MKSIVLILGLISSTVATSTSLTETNTYKELHLDFGIEDSVSLTVQGERYRSTQSRTLISIKKVSVDTYIVDQENLYYPAVMIYPPLPTVTFRDTLTTTIKKWRADTVRIFVPTNLEAGVSEVPDQFSRICLAYWTGFEYDQNTDSCVERGTSGCRNPFEFLTLDECEKGNLLN